MAWCPKCKCEYVEGVTVCADCGCELVDHLDGTEDEILQTDPQKIAQAFIRTGEALPEELLDSELLQDFDFDEEEAKPTVQKAYRNSAEQAKENRASAFSLLFVGGAGFVFILLFFLDVSDLHMTLLSKYMVSGVMGVLVILFIVMGIISLRNSKILKKKAYKENNLTQEIKRWCMDRFRKEEIDAILEIDKQQEELQYFARAKYMKEAIQKQFMNLEEGYLDRLIEEVYAEIFE